jgi:PRTRC genetic system protein B
MTMKNITQQFNARFVPFKALLIYRFDKEEKADQFQNSEKETQVYVESYDIGYNGKPINAHPLSVKEMNSLSGLLQTTQELKGGYLKSKGLLPPNTLFVQQQSNGYAIWYTPVQEVNLFFIDGLNIPSGQYKIPAMLWKANAEKLTVFSLKGKTRPTENTVLCHAPYLNIYNNGLVCMGTVNIDIGKSACLEDFIELWQRYFFNSFFSHSISGNSTTKSNTTELWRKLAGTGKDFPQKELIKSGYTIKNLME